MRRGPGGMQRVSPGWAARAAQALFCTPLPLKWVSRRQTVPGGFEVLRWPFGGGSLVLCRPRVVVPDAPLVLLVHGWGGSGLQWSVLAEDLVARGLAPVMLDFPAHGRAEGWRSNLPQFNRAQDCVIQRLVAQGADEPRPLRAMVAHSLGATAAAMACAPGAAVRCLVLAAPAGSPLGYLQGFAAVFGPGETSRTAMQMRIKSDEAMLMASWEAHALAPRRALPLLVVHDVQDRVNPFGDGQAYAGLAPQARLFSTSGLGHRRPLRDAQVLAEVARFVVAPVA